MIEPVQVVPDDDIPHELTTLCWCQPGVEEDVVTGGLVVTHRRYLDGPLYEPGSEALERKVAEVMAKRLDA